MKAPESFNVFTQKFDPAVRGNHEKLDDVAAFETNVAGVTINSVSGTAIAGTRTSATVFTRSSGVWIKKVIIPISSVSGTFVDGELIEPGRPFEVEPGVPLTIGDTLISLGKPYEPEPGMTQYALDLLGDTGESRQSLLHRDRRITNRKNLELIYEVSTLLMQTLDIREICETILDNLFDCLKRIDTGAILLNVVIDRMNALRLNPFEDFVDS